jgi:hypothetical protein
MKAVIANLRRDHERLSVLAHRPSGQNDAVCEYQLVSYFLPYCTHMSAGATLLCRNDENVGYA